MGELWKCIKKVRENAGEAEAKQRKRVINKVSNMSGGLSENQAPAHEYRYRRYTHVDENILWHFNTSEILFLCVRVCVAGCFQSVCIIVKRK